jgi:hypothetical protein
MIKRLNFVAVAVGAFFLVAGVGSVAHAQSKCAGDKIKATAKKASCKASLEAKQAAKGGTIDPAKVAKCEATFSKSFAKSELKGGCISTGDAATIESKVDAFVVDLEGELDVGTGTNPNTCESDKIKAAAKKASCKSALESKQASKGGTIDPAKVAKCEATFSKSFAKAELKGGCNTTGDAAAIEAKVDAFVDDADTEINPTTSTTTSTTSSTTTSTTTSTTSSTTTSTTSSTTTSTSTSTIATTSTTSSTTTSTTSSTTTSTLACCAAAEIVTLTSAGTLVVDSLNAFPFPAGVQTNINAEPAVADCRHPSTVSTFSVPPFCIVGLGFTSDVFPTGCALGTALGNGSVWDETATNPTPNIFRHGDTSDGVCNPGGQLCTTAPGQAGANTLGDIDATRGSGPAAPTGRVHTQIDIPVRSLTWSDGDGSPDCPDEDGVYNSGQDNTITDFNFILSPTTGQTRAQYVDKNMDSCSFAGGGPASTRICSNDSSKPCSFAVDCGAGPTCNGGPLQGSAPLGPCCVVGQATTVVATGNAFSGAGPLFDLIFMNSSPTTISACNPLGPLQTCTLTTDPCAD